MARDKTLQTQNTEVAHKDSTRGDAGQTIKDVKEGVKPATAKTPANATKTSVAAVPLPTDLEPYLNSAKEVWLVCKGLKGEPRVRLDDPMIDSLLTDHLYRVGFPRESVKALRHRLAAEAYRKADLAKDPLDDTLTYALYVLAQERAKAEPWTTGAFQLEESAYLQAVRLKLDASVWPKKNWFSRAVKDRIEDLHQVFVKVVAEPRGNLGQHFTFSLLPKPTGGDASDAILEGGDASDAISTSDGSPVPESEATAEEERPDPYTLADEQAWKALHAMLPQLRQGPRVNLLLIGSPEVSQMVVEELLRSVVCETTPNTFGCGTCAACKYVGVLDQFTDAQESEGVRYCYFSGEKLDGTEANMVEQRSAMQASTFRQIIYLESADRVTAKKTKKALLRYVVEDDRVNWIASAENIRDVDERLLEHFPLDVHLKR